MADEKTVKIKVVFEADAGAAEKAAQDVVNSAQKVNKEAKSAYETFGIMDTKIGKMASGIIDFGKKGVNAMTTLKGAIISTGIGALVIAVTSLIMYFTKTERGAEKLKVAMAAVGQVVSAVVDTFIKIGETLMKIGQIIGKVVKGQESLKDAWKETKDVVKGAVNEVADSYSKLNSKVQQAMDLARRENQLRKDLREEMVNDAKDTVKLAQLREDLADRDIEAAERLKLLNEAMGLNNQMADDDIKFAREAYEIKKAKNALSESTAEDLDEEARLLAEVINKEAERSNMNRMYVRMRQTINKELAATEKERLDEEKKIADEEAKALEEKMKLEQAAAEKKIADTKKLQDELELLRLDGQLREAEQLQQKYEAELAIIGENEEARTLLYEKYQILNNELKKKYDDEAAAAKAENDKITEAQEKAHQEAMTSMRNEGFNALATIAGAMQTLAGKNKKLAIAGILIEKGLAIGEIIVNTAKATMKAVSASPLTFGMPWSAINVAAGALSIAATVKAGADAINQINSAKTEQGKTPFLKAATGGLIVGPSHASGGVDINAEGGEFIVNKRTMSNPAMAQSIQAMNSGNMGTASILSEERVAEIAAQTLKAIPVYVTERDITDTQKKVQTREAKYVQ